MERQFTGDFLVREEKKLQESIESAMDGLECIGRIRELLQTARLLEVEAVLMAGNLPCLLRMACTEGEQLGEMLFSRRGRSPERN
jgi:hypothetical protein